MSHYKSITITRSDGKHYNIRSVVDGKQLSDNEAIRHAEKTNSFGKSFNSIPEAVSAAKALSATQKEPNSSGRGLIESNQTHKH